MNRFRTYSLSVLISVFSFTGLSGQNAFPTLSDTARWSVLEFQMFSGSSTVMYTYDYDTAFCGQVYSKLSFSDILSGYIRSDQDRGYFRYSADCGQPEQVFYDYSLEVGDTLRMACTTTPGWPMFIPDMPFLVDNIDTVTIAGIERQRFRVMHSAGDINGPLIWGMYWIKGIGSVTHPFYPLKCLQHGCETNYKLLCYDSTDVQLYINTTYNTCDTTIIGIAETENPDPVRIGPVPFGAELNIGISGVLIEAIRIRDLIGSVHIDEKGIGSSEYRVDTRSLTPGIYFIETETRSGTAVRRIIKTGQSE